MSAFMVFIAAWAFTEGMCHPAHKPHKGRNIGTYGQGVMMEVPGPFEIRARLHPKEGLISGTAGVTVPKAGLRLLVPEQTEISSFSLDGKPFEYELRPAGSGRGGTVSLSADLAGSRLEVDFVSRFEQGLSAATAPDTKEFMGGIYWSDDFVMLLSPWCPVSEGRFSYHLEISVPAGYTPVSESDYVIVTSAENGDKGQGKEGSSSCYSFIFPYGREFPSLVAGRFSTFSRETDLGIGLHVYLLKSDRDLALQYLDAMERFIRLYSDMIGPYPYKRFSVVANRAQTGFGLPTFTLIGDRLMAMPFIREISLGHEILHSWFGNGVLVDYSLGNWCEGLTTYLADHYFMELKGKGALWRHDALAEFAAYVTEGRGMPLSSFAHRTDRASKAVGYEKGAMVFHMLRKIVGDGSFFDSLREFYKRYRFRPASWKDIEGVFEAVTGRRLDWFFSQWLKTTELPGFSFQGARLGRDSSGGFMVEMEVKAEGFEAPIRMDLPFVAVSPKGSETVSARLSLDPEKGASQKIVLRLSQRPVSLFFDPEYDLARRLSDPEMPAMIALLLGDPDRYVVIGQDARKGIYEKAARFFEKEGFKLVKQDEIKHQMVKSASFLVLGRAKGRLAGMIPDLDKTKAAAVIAVRKNPLNPRHVVAAVRAEDASVLKRALSKAPHYGKYSRLEFDEEGRVVRKVRSSYVEGIEVKFQPMALGVASSSLKEADAIYRQLLPYRVVYLGETHDDAGFHQVQFQVVKSLFESGKKIAVGLEMFQVPFQKVIDDYLAGRIDEKAFLKGTEYFKRWKFNYRFYRPVIQFCRENGVPVVALNIPAEVSRKIARTGLDSLTEKERAWLPKEMDMSNRAYRYHLQEVFAQHQEAPVEDFEYFFQAQIAWDESMAANIVRYLQRHPDRSMVVLVGSGHVAYRFGIPSRVERRGIREQTVVLSGREKVLDPDEADFFMFPPQLPEPFSAKLGVLLSDKEQLKVKKVVDGSPAAEAGIEPGDVITALDGVEVKTLEDLRLELLFKEEGQKVRITVLRSRKGKGPERLDLESGPLKAVDFSSAMGGFHSTMTLRSGMMSKITAKTRGAKAGMKYEKGTRPEKGRGEDSK